MASGRGPARLPPLSARLPPAGQDMIGNGAIAAARRTELGPRQAPAAEPAPVDTVEAAPAAAASSAAPDVKARPGPGADPKFATLKKDVQRKKRSVASSHPPPRTEAGAAQDAARPPRDDEEAQGKTANAEKMNEAEPKDFDKDAFIRAVEKAIAEKAPKNLDEADKFADSGKADGVRAEVHGKVGEGRAESAEQIATTTAAPPDTSAAVPKKVVPMAADRPPGTPAAPDPANAVPDKLPPSATDMSAGPAQVDRQMAVANVSETQLKRSNEPTFDKALGEKKAAERHSATAPGQLRKHEAGELRESTAQAKRLGTAAMGAMGTQRVRTGQRVDTGKTGTKGRDEEKRAQVTAVLQGVFDTMKKDVEAILDGLDKLVDDQFGRGEKAARDAFNAEHKRKMDEYKDRRYSGVRGKLRWVRDKFAGLPAEADKIFEEARDNYVRRMRQVISDVADTIGTELNRAKRRIAQGRTELQAAVRKLPADLRSIGRQAAAEFTDKFDELTQSVDDKGTQLVDTLATKYTDALRSVDDEIAAEKEKNKGLVAKAVDAVKAVINTILELKRLLLSVLAKAAQAVMLILKDPIGFLRNLVSAVGAGLRQFLQNIGRHLQQGILSWLLGKTAEAGLELPSKFDTQGVLKMLASLLGLTWQSIRARIVRKVPKMEPAVAAAETAVPLVAEVRKRGVAGMWDDLKTRVGDLRKDLLDKVITYVTPTIVVAGIIWVISLLNPASAFVRAVKLIIDIVRFIVTQARQIFEFVNAVLDAVIAIARGGSGGVPGLIERALARSIPVLLGVLAAILGVGGIAARVKQIVQAMSKPVNRAVDWVIDKIVGMVKKLWSKIKSKFDKKDKKEPRKSRKPSRHQKPGRRPAGSRKPRARPDKKKKEHDGKDVEVPKRLTEPTELAISQVGRELAKEIQEARDGKILHQTGGDPKQVTKVLLAQHGDARYNKASGTLILPRLSGGITGSLSALGAQIAGQTGVSKVTLEKKGENAEVWGGINPRVRLAKIKGLPTDEAILRIAVTQVGIVQFLKNMASGTPMTVTQGTVTGTIGMPELQAAWTKQPNVDFLKTRFRGAMKGHHEWLPSDYILEVTQAAARDLVAGPKWIDLQHELRSATFQVVYKPALAAPMIVQDKLASDTTKRPYSVPHGHVGAVYYPGRSGKEKTDGSSTFHNELRTAFTGASTVKASAQAAHAVAKRWVWDGSLISPDIHPKCVDKNSRQVTAAGQAVNVANIEALFQKFI
ncbi:hypothetical protein ABZS86_25260 [Streptomyces sp. NPDC005355]|uniref:hypothetical protein n=1 Tax=Streptomyces sp. NPDC005355 TaxID=3157038 RepID=UPI0033B185FF